MLTVVFRLRIASDRFWYACVSARSGALCSVWPSPWLGWMAATFQHIPILVENKGKMRGERINLFIRMCRQAIETLLVKHLQFAMLSHSECSMWNSEWFAATFVCSNVSGFCGLPQLFSVFCLPPHSVMNWRTRPASHLFRTIYESHSHAYTQHQTDTSLNGMVHNSRQKW